MRTDNVRFLPIERVTKELDRAAGYIERYEINTIRRGLCIMCARDLLVTIGKSARHPRIGDLARVHARSSSRTRAKTISLFYIAYRVAKRMHPEKRRLDVIEVLGFWTSCLLEMSCFAPLLRETAKELRI